MMSHAPLLNFFDKLYIINLPEREDRRKQIRRELTAIGISDSSEKVVFFPAIKPAEKGDFPSIGARGCFLSHLAVLKEARQHQLSNLLIMEDDLTFNSFLLQRQAAIVQELQHLNWDFAYLGHGLNLSKRQKGFFQEYSDPLRLAHFLAINQTKIPQLVEFLETILKRPNGHPKGGPMHVDGAYSVFRKQHPDTVTLVANPNLGFQRPSPSNIAGYKWFEGIPIMSSVVGGARHIKTWHQRNFTI